MKTPIRRTFHVPTQHTSTLDISEWGDRISITAGAEELFLSREQWRMLCSLDYELRWDWDKLDAEPSTDEL